MMTYYKNSLMERGTKMLRERTNKFKHCVTQFLFTTSGNFTDNRAWCTVSVIPRYVPE